jgi:hypothetical protein
MQRKIIYFILALVVTSCGGGSKVINTGDVIQFRRILEDDPLAAKIHTEDGSEVLLGDIIMKDTGILRTSVRENEDGMFDIEMTLDDRERARMNEFWRRDSTRELVVILDGKFWAIVNGDILISKTKMLLINYADNESDAQVLAERLTAWKKNRTK